MDCLGDPSSISVGWMNQIHDKFYGAISTFKYGIFNQGH